MFSMIKENIRSFLDVTVVITMVAIGAFAIIGDYMYFKKMKYKKDAAASLGIGVAFMLLPFVLLFISKL